jgi:hypothetical protein
MKKLKFTTMPVIALYAMLMIGVSSCESEKSKTIVTEARATSDYELIGYPVKLHYIKRCGMKYMIASGLYGEAGVSVCNLTLDSLQVEFYKRSIK